LNFHVIMSPACVASVLSTGSEDCAIVTKGSYKGAASGFFAGVLLLVAA
jgi:hypothetical protein